MRAEAKIAVRNPIDFEQTLERLAERLIVIDDCDESLSFFSLGVFIAGNHLSERECIPPANRKLVIHWYRWTMTWYERINPSPLGISSLSVILTSSARDLRAHFIHHLAAMNFDRDLAGPQFTRDLLVEQAGDNQAHHFPLARGQRIEPLAQFCNFRSRAAARRGRAQGLVESRPEDPDRGRAW